MIDYTTILVAILSLLPVVAGAVISLRSKLEEVAQRHESAAQKIVDAISTLQSDTQDVSTLVSAAQSAAQTVANAQAQSSS